MCWVWQYWGYSHLPLSHIFKQIMLTYWLFRIIVDANYCVPYFYFFQIWFPLFASSLVQICTILIIFGFWGLSWCTYFSLPFICCFFWWLLCGQILMPAFTFKVVYWVWQWWRYSHLPLSHILKQIMLAY